MKSLLLIIGAVYSIITIQYGAHQLDHANGCTLLSARDWSQQNHDTVSRLSSGAIKITKDYENLNPSSDLEPYMSRVKNQLNIGACSAFSEIAIIEFLIPGVRFSEAELMIRMVTNGAKDTDTRNDNGIALTRFEPIIRTGLIPEENFVPYTAYNAYTSQRKTNKQPDVLAISADYKQSIEHLRQLCSQDIPAIEFLPNWVAEDDYVFGDDCTMITTARPIGYWKRIHFNVFEVNPNNLIRLKEILQYVPVSIAIHNLIDKVTRKSWFNQPKGKNGSAAIIRLGSDHKANFESDSAHAICLCGYDDRIQAFKFKNSWGTHDSSGVPYGNNGYAYISYAAVQLYGNHAVTIVTHPTIQLTSVELSNAEFQGPSILNRMLLEFAARKAKGQL